MKQLIIAIVLTMSSSLAHTHETVVLELVSEDRVENNKPVCLYVSDHTGEQYYWFKTDMKECPMTLTIGI